MNYLSLNCVIFITTVNQIRHYVSKSLNETAQKTSYPTGRIGL